MSCFIVDREHVRALVDSAARLGLLERGEGPWALRTMIAAVRQGEAAAGREPSDLPSIVGRILWSENRKSCEARYPDTVGHPENLPGPCEEGPAVGEAYVHKPRKWPLLPGAVGHAVACYEYQTCEHDGWQGSPVREFCRSIIEAALEKAPGAAACPWDINADLPYGDPKNRTKLYCGPADEGILLTSLIPPRKR